MRVYVVTEDTEVRFSDGNYVLQRGDKILINEYVEDEEELKAKMAEMGVESAYPYPDVDDIGEVDDETNVETGETKPMEYDRIIGAMVVLMDIAGEEGVKSFVSDLDDTKKDMLRKYLDIEV